MKYLLFFSLYFVQNDFGAGGDWASYIDGLHHQKFLARTHQTGLDGLAGYFESRHCTCILRRTMLNETFAEIFSKYFK